MLERADTMSKIAVIFPGMGYTKDRPLLYFAGKIAKSCGYELVFVDMKMFPGTRSCFGIMPK